MNLEKNDLTSWRNFMKKFVNPLFDKSKRDEYEEYLKKMQTPFFPDFNMAEDFYEKIKSDVRFDDELKLFFSFLYSCNFFGNHLINFENWITMPNWVASPLLGQK